MANTTSHELDPDDVVLCPTETVVGLIGRADRIRPLRRIQAIKKRKSDHPFPLIASSVDQVRAVARSWSDAYAALASHFWPGPLSLLIDCDIERHFPDTGLFVAHAGRVACRVPGESQAADLIQDSASLWAATSANVSGQSPALHTKEVPTELREAVDLVVDGAAGGSLPSTLLHITQEGSSVACQFLRDGGILRTEILDFLRDVGMVVSLASTKQ